MPHQAIHYDNDARNKKTEHQLMQQQQQQQLSSAQPTSASVSASVSVQQTPSLHSTSTMDSSDINVLDRYLVEDNNNNSSDERKMLRQSSSTDSALQGGPLWRLAGLQAQQQHQHPHNQHQQPQQYEEEWSARMVDSTDITATTAAPPSPLLPPAPKRKGPPRMLAETIFQGTQSRADPNAVIMSSSEGGQAPSTAPSTMVRIDDEDFLRNTGLAHKRVRVVQLLAIGFAVLLFGWLGNFFVGYSCHFTAIDIAVGQNGDMFALHFGLWKYSPADSALNGYTYCYPYGGSHSQDAPIVARWTNLLALLVGTYSLIILWLYLIAGRAYVTYWKWAVRCAALAGVFQLSTLFFFLGHLCRQHACHAGPASILAIVTAVAWWILSWELQYHMPIILEHKKSKASGSLVANIEMADLAVASQDFMERFHPSQQLQQDCNNHCYEPPRVV